MGIVPCPGDTVAMRPARRAPVPAVAAAVAALVLAGCGSSSDGGTPSASAPVPSPTTASPSPTGTGTASARPSATSTASGAAVTPTIESALVTGLRAPWGMAFLPDGSALVSLRDDGTILRVRPTRSGGAQVEQVGEVPETAAEGEGGLLGLAVQPGARPMWVLAYVTTSEDNRVVRMSWDGTRLGAPQPVLTGIPRGSIHDGGGLAIGRDGFVYVSTGETGNPELAQDLGSLGGKILRIRPDGRAAPGNPLPDHPLLWTWGHRNVQGLAFDAEGRLWASEYGARDVDELNLIRRGGNYGWPRFEGAGGDPDYVDPVIAWSPTALASPSGIAAARGSIWIASLRGQVLWQVPIDAAGRAGEPIARFREELGRLRNVALAPDGTLWLLTNNTDGRGDPGPQDDRLLRLSLTP